MGKADGLTVRRVSQRFMRNNEYIKTNSVPKHETYASAGLTLD